MATAEPEVLATGYQLVEGPRADGQGGVYFTDALGGGVYRWSVDGIEIVVPKRRGVGGLALHTDGGVVVSGRDVTHVAPDGTNRLLFAKITPNLRKIGLLSDRLTGRLVAIGAMAPDL